MRRTLVLEADDSDSEVRAVWQRDIDHPLFTHFGVASGRVRVVRDEIVEGAS